MRIFCLVVAIVLRQSPSAHCFSLHHCFKQSKSNIKSILAKNLSKYLLPDCVPNVSSRNDPVFYSFLLNATLTYCINSRIFSVHNPYLCSITISIIVRIMHDIRLHRLWLSLRCATRVLWQWGDNEIWDRQPDTRHLCHSHTPCKRLRSLLSTFSIRIGRKKQ